MADKLRGIQSVQFINPPVIIGVGTIVGPKEAAGPIGDRFHQVIPDYLYGEDTPEQAETKILKEAIELALKNGNIAPSAVQFLLAGDLLNQIVSSGFAARQLGIAFLGIYGACSTIAEGLSIGSMIIDGGFADNIVVGASSHYQSAERQYRYPIELNIQHKATSQWTVTGAGAAVIASGGQGPRVTTATIGKVMDMGTKNPNEMGPAMAPAAADTFIRHLQDLGRSPEYYDLILTGDLGNVGKQLFLTLVKKNGITLNKYDDCGVIIFDKGQRSGAGGSGCACAATVTFGHAFKELEAGNLKKILLVATGALLSPLTYQQGESIPGIAHAVSIET